MSSLPIVVGASESIDTELIEILGSISAILATIGLALLLPIYISHRREVERLLEWKDQEPEAGTTEFRAIPAPSGTVPATPGRSGGKMTPAERVTSERPALTRISTGEYAALEPEPKGFWQRVVERGPRHPLVLAIIAILIGVGAVFAGSQLIKNDDDTGGGNKVDPATVSIAVVNGTSEPGVANDVSDLLEKKGFVIDSNSVASGPDPAKASAVFYAKGERAAGKAVARVLKLPRPTPFGQEEEAAANGASVVVVVGEDGQAGGDQVDSSGGDTSKSDDADPSTAPAGEG